MEILKTKKIDENQFQQINELWNEEYPIKLKNRFGLLLEGVTNYNHYLIEENNQILAWAVDFEKENETRFSIIVNKKHQGKGLGGLLIDRLKKDLGEFYGWVIDHNNDIKENGEFYQTPLSFYRNKGFEILSDKRIDSEIIKAVKIKSKIKVFSETEQFILREILPTDIDGMFELHSDPEVHRFLGNKTLTQTEVFKPKISRLLVILNIIFILFGIIFTFIKIREDKEFKLQNLFPLIFCIYGSFMLLKIFSTKYCLNNKGIQISDVFNKFEIKYEDIKEIEKRKINLAFRHGTKGRIRSETCSDTIFITSSKRIYNQKYTVIISPKNEENFINRLKITLNEI